MRTGGRGRENERIKGVKGGEGKEGGGKRKGRKEGRDKDR